MKKFKIWVAVDDDGTIYVYVKNKPEYVKSGKFWVNFGAYFLNIGCDKELKAGEDSFVEIEFELPLKGELNEKDN